MNPSKANTEGLITVLVAGGTLSVYQVLSSSFPPLDWFQDQSCANHISLSAELGSASYHVCSDNGVHSSGLSAGKSFLNYYIALKHISGFNTFS
jgi:hypothetical protein